MQQCLDDTPISESCQHRSKRTARFSSCRHQALELNGVSSIGTMALKTAIFALLQPVPPVVACVSSTSFEVTTSWIVDSACCSWALCSFFICAIGSLSTNGCTDHYPEKKLFIHVKATRIYEAIRLLRKFRSMTPLLTHVCVLCTSQVACIENHLGVCMTHVFADYSPN